MAASAAKLLHGVIPALVSPFKSDEDGGGVDTDAVAPLIEHLLDASDPVKCVVEACRAVASASVVADGITDTASSS